MNLARLGRKFSFKRNTTQLPVQVDFSLIKEEKKELYSKIEEAYNDEGLGVIVVNNIPGFSEKRKNLLPFAHKIANLTDDQK